MSGGVILLPGAQMLALRFVRTGIVMGVFRSSIVAALVGATASVLGASAASAGQGYFITLTSKWDAVVEISVRPNATHRWMLKEIGKPVQLRKNESKTFYTEACGFWDGCSTSSSQNQSSRTALDFYVTIDGKKRDEVDISYDSQLFKSESEARCLTGTWHSGEKPVIRAPLALNKKGDQYVLNVTVAPGTGIVCTTE
ncbi:hypothetical protein GCM10007301_02190 [Azorhizobium oxalatiphilum]|uniref:Uncharacterized protein n=1 Tax=Azorhizobium oxalatiphilum TaxID=980631 RepID=A0A917F5S5_9HYPH|nr:hypothetical protein [Azorhizobium oxalatiphilum]GGF46241.1 hypothetical protein GCM10007301_02190 [Azorhizobium oxalatiphilum]